MFVKPGEGRSQDDPTKKITYVVRDPDTRIPLPAEGSEVPNTPYWYCRLRDGDVVLADPPAIEGATIASTGTIGSGSSITSAGTVDSGSSVVSAGTIAAMGTAAASPASIVAPPVVHVAAAPVISSVANGGTISPGVTNAMAEEIIHFTGSIDGIGEIDAVGTVGGQHPSLGASARPAAKD